jgi:nitroreductase
MEYQILEVDMSLTTKVRWIFGEYTKEDMMKMDPAALGALLRERTHHTIEVPLYPTLLKEKSKPVSSFGLEAQAVFDVWRERGFPEDTQDIKWVSNYLGIAEKIRAGEKVELDLPLPTPFTDEEMAVVHKLIYQRHSIRDFAEGAIPDELIDKILEAGRAAPNGCNLNMIRFIVLKDPEEIKMIRSDISGKNAVIIVITHDTRVPEVVGQDKVVPHNAGFDAAAAGDHMLLMAHALGLGAVWLSEIKSTDGKWDTGREFAQKYGLPDHIVVDLHIAIGWPTLGTIKSARIPLESMIIRKQRN